MVKAIYGIPSPYTSAPNSVFQSHSAPPLFLQDLWPGLIIEKGSSLSLLSSFSPSLCLSLLDLRFQKRIKILNPGREWLLLGDLAGAPHLPFPLPFLLCFSIFLAHLYIKMDPAKREWQKEWASLTVLAHGWPHKALPCEQGNNGGEASTVDALSSLGSRWCVTE